MAKNKKRTRPVSLTLRVGLGKLFGAGVGLAVFFSLPTLQADIDLALRFGMWGWYILFGAVIGFAGLYTKHPVLGWPLPALLRGAFVGFIMNLILGALIHQDMLLAFAPYADFPGMRSMPILEMAIEGLIWGALMDVALTFYAGEGKNLTKNL